MSNVEQWEHDEQRAMENEIISLREQVATLTKDAERYRWLRKNSTGFCEFSIAVDEDGIANRGMRMEQIPEMLDAAIDAAMEGK